MTPANGFEAKLTLPRPPRSLKNRRQLIPIWAEGASRAVKRWLKTMISVPSAEAKKDKKAVQDAAAHYAQPDGSLFKDDSVALEVVHHVDTDKVTVRCWSIGPKPKKGRTGRRLDVPNLHDVVADALEKLVYDNDRQVSLLVVKRVDGNGELL